MRYAWDPSFLQGEEIGTLTRRIAPLATAWLRHVDRKRAAGPDVFVANSSFVAARIRQSYARDAVVIHPPVHVEEFLGNPRHPSDAYLVFGRVVPYKRVGMAVEACERLGRPLHVAGDGRDLAHVRQLAGRHTTFLGHVSDADVPRLFAEARALLFPGLEDFGIVPVEAQAAGLPVIAFGEGGARDSILDGETGMLYAPGSVEALCDAIERFETREFDDTALRANARRFSADTFASAFTELLMSL